MTFVVPFWCVCFRSVGRFSDYSAKDLVYDYETLRKTVSKLDKIVGLKVVTRLHAGKMGTFYSMLGLRSLTSPAQPVCYNLRQTNHIVATVAQDGDRAILRSTLAQTIFESVLMSGRIFLFN